MENVIQKRSVLVSEGRKGKESGRKSTSDKKEGWLWVRRSGTEITENIIIRQ